MKIVKVNGKETNFDGKSVLECLELLGFDKRAVAVEKNGEIVPRATYEKTFFKNGDTAEIVNFVGGG